MYEFAQTGGEPELFYYTALGDSVTAGESASSPRHVYPRLTAERMSKRLCIRVIPFVLANPGWTSATLTSAAFGLPFLPLCRSDAISIWIGGNDLAQAALFIPDGASPAALQRTLAEYERHLTVLVQEILSNKEVPLVLCGQYNPFPNSRFASQGIRSLNEITAAVAKRFDTRYAPTDVWFAGREAELIHGYRTGRLEDVWRCSVLPIHPNDRGHEVIACHLAPLLTER
jgi:acyl-CoA thioesterase-1